MTSGGNSEASRGYQASFVGNSCGYRYTNSSSSSQFVVVCVALTSSTNIDYYFDGVLQPSTSLFFTNWPDSGSNISIGCPSTVTASPFIGNLHELVHYNKVLTSSEISTLSTFLKNKWWQSVLKWTVSNSLVDRILPTNNYIAWNVQSISKQNQSIFLLFTVFFIVCVLGGFLRIWLNLQRISHIRRNCSNRPFSTSLSRSSLAAVFGEGNNLIG
jgi:hypothetical protein